MPRRNYDDLSKQELIDLLKARDRESPEVKGGLADNPAPPAPRDKVKTMPPKVVAKLKKELDAYEKNGKQTIESIMQRSIERMRKQLAERDAARKPRPAIGEPAPRKGDGK